jgi:CheY-like chemotaxis protein
MDTRRPPSHLADLTGLTVLVVDDDADTLELLRCIIGSRGAQVVTASGAGQAMEQLETACPDVIVSDLEMPDGDGFGLIERVRACPQAQGGFVPAIALTALTDNASRQRALRAGFWRHLAKPVDATLLCAEIARLGKTYRRSSPPRPG